MVPALLTYCPTAVFSRIAPPSAAPMFQRGRIDHFALNVPDAETLEQLRNKLLARGTTDGTVTDGPYAEIKEQVGGFFLLEARDMKQAIELMSKHPGLKAGPFEIRPVEDMTEAIRASERRRAAAATR